MNEKKTNESETLRFEVKKRRHKEKPDYFQNIPPFAFPLAAIFKRPEIEINDPVSDEIEDLKPANLETRAVKFGNPEVENSDAVQPEFENSETGNIEKTKTSNYLKKYEKARSTEPIHARVEKAVARRIRNFLVDSKFTLKEFIEISTTKFIDEFGSPHNKSLGGGQSSDGRKRLITWKTRPAVINLYLDYNSVSNKKSRWSVRNDDAAFEFNKVDIRLIELGIIQTQANKNFAGKINSFSYYANEIQHFIELKMPEQSIEIMLEVNRQRWIQNTGRTLNTK